MFETILLACKKTGFTVTADGLGYHFQKGDLSFFTEPTPPIVPTIGEIKDMVYQHWHTLLHHQILHPSADNERKANEVLALFNALN